MTATNSLDDAHGAQSALTGDPATFWRPCEGTELADITLQFPAERTVDKLVLMDDIASGQPIESFTLAREHDGQWLTFISGEVVGYERICRFDAQRTRALRIHIGASRGHPTLAFIGAYGDPE